MRRVLLWILMLALAMWFGSSVYFTFFAAPELFAGLPVDTAGRAVGLIFPTFFQVCFITALISWLLYWVVLPRPSRRRSRYLMGYVAALVGTILSAGNTFVLLPMVSHQEKVMGPVSTASSANLKTFGMLHGASMSVDALCILAACLVWIALAAQLEVPNHSPWRELS